MVTYIDLQILGEASEDTYLVTFDKQELSRLVRFSEGLVIRHWDGEKPIVLEDYGESAVRTREDGSEANNLANLPKAKSEITSG